MKRHDLHRNKEQNRGQYVSRKVYDWRNSVRASRQKKNRKKKVRLSPKTIVLDVALSIFALSLRVSGAIIMDCSDRDSCRINKKSLIMITQFISNPQFM